MRLWWDDGEAMRASMARVRLQSFAAATVSVKAGREKRNRVGGCWTPCRREQRGAAGRHVAENRGEGIHARTGEGNDEQEGRG